MNVPVKIFTDASSVSDIRGYAEKGWVSGFTTNPTFQRVVVVEEHAPQGGLSSQIKQIAWDMEAKCTLKVITLQDSFIHSYGTYADILAAHGISPDAIRAAILD